MSFMICSSSFLQPPHTYSLCCARGCDIFFIYREREQSKKAFICSLCLIACAHILWCNYVPSQVLAGTHILIIQFHIIFARLTICMYKISIVLPLLNYMSIKMARAQFHDLPMVLIAYGYIIYGVCAGFNTIPSPITQ